MAQDPNEIFDQQRMQKIQQQQNVRGTMETVGLEQREAQSTIAKYQVWIVNFLAVVGALAIGYLILNAVL